MIVFPVDYTIEGIRYVFTYVADLGQPSALVQVTIDKNQYVKVARVTMKEVTSFVERQKLFEIIAETTKLVRTLTTNWYSETGCIWCGNPRLFPDEAEMVSHNPDCLHFQAYKIHELIKELIHE